MKMVYKLESLAVKYLSFKIESTLLNIFELFMTIPLTMYDFLVRTVSFQLFLSVEFAVLTNYNEIHSILLMVLLELFLINH